GGTPQHPSCIARSMKELVQFTFAVIATNFATFAVPFCFTAKSAKWAQRSAKAFIGVFAKLHHYPRIRIVVC
ncbi:MAG TPA: hypothetical protein VI750_03845, partial [Pyrinomonadaceae bacterium]|nr:hypothetical protein [Pyrinomonadaceae bacterium]